MSGLDAQKDEQKQKMRSRIYVGINHNIFSKDVFDSEAFGSKISEKYSPMLVDQPYYQSVFDPDDEYLKNAKQIYESILAQI